MDKLIAALKFGGILSDNSVDKILPHYHKKIFKAGDYFLEKGNVSNQIGFLENGILRTFALDEDGTEVVKYFVKENQFCVDLESYYTSSPSDENFQAIVKTEMYVITKQALTSLAEDIPNFYIYFKSITESQLLNKIKDNDFLNFGNAKTKYLEFNKRYPTLVNRVPVQYIASYLKITPQSLSRIRKDIAKNGF